MSGFDRTHLYLVFHHHIFTYDFRSCQLLTVKEYRRNEVTIMPSRCQVSNFIQGMFIESLTTTKRTWTTTSS
jgi:hypothetical protein